MTKREKSLLVEYRYNKLCRLENRVNSSYNLLLKNMDFHPAIISHHYDVVYLDCFRKVMREVFELLKLKENNKNA